MKHLELHIIQSVPVACLNRDDLNSPKTAIFGGVQRARVSSQSWKRAIREMAQNSEYGHLFRGNRSKLLINALATRLEKNKVPKETAVVIAEHVASIVETLDSNFDATGYQKIKTMMFFSDAEYDAIIERVTDEIKKKAEAVAKFKAELENIEKIKKEEVEKNLKKSEKDLKKEFGDKAIKGAIKSAQLKDAADISIFGRMVAKDHSLTVEAASMFSHALSVHKADNEIDFFTAVDDLQPKGEDAGAGMMGSLEFNSATYYRFAALNLDMLADENHLNSMTLDERKSVVRTFVEATIKSIPGARKNTMNANTIPDYVFGVVREKGHPIQLVNAFENPLRSSKGYKEEAIKQLKSEYEKLKTTWDIQAVFDKAIPDMGIKEFLGEVEKHVI